MSPTKSGSQGIEFVLRTIDKGGRLYLEPWPDAYPIDVTDEVRASYHSRPRRYRVYLLGLIPIGPIMEGPIPKEGKRILRWYLRPFTTLREGAF